MLRADGHADFFLGVFFGERGLLGERRTEHCPSTHFPFPEAHGVPSAMGVQEVVETAGLHCSHLEGEGGGTGR